MPLNSQQKRLFLKLIMVALIMAFTLLRPHVEAWLSGKAPGSGSPKVDSTASTAPGLPAEFPHVDFIEPKEEAQEGSSQERPSTESSESTDAVSEVTEASEVTVKPPAQKPTRNRPPVSERDNSSRPPAPKDSNPKSDQEAGPAADVPLGKLTEIRRKVYQSTAGLLYVPGSADGHRLDHVMQHAEDDPSKKVHGVFEGDRETILALIDEAFLLALKRRKEARSELQNGRRVYTVRLNRRIGYVGGQDGSRQRNPECRFLRLVVEEDDDSEPVVVSAYPTRSF